MTRRTFFHILCFFNLVIAVTQVVLIITGTAKNPWHLLIGFMILVWVHFNPEKEGRYQSCSGSSTSPS